MNLKRSHTAWGAMIALTVVAAPMLAMAAVAPAKPEAKEPEPPKSVFAMNPKNGKDPFFPKSERWNPPPPKPVEPTPTATATAVKPKEPEPVNPYEFFDLKGFVGSGNGRVVTISSGSKNFIMMMGESKQAVTPKGTFRFKVVGFTETGVIIHVDGQKKDGELNLPTP